MEKANCTIPLAETQMEVFSGDSGEIWTKTPKPAKVTMRLLPAPRVFIEIIDMPILFSSDIYNPGRLSRLRLPFGPAIEVGTRKAGSTG